MIYRLIYLSSAATVITEADLAQILSDARNNNSCAGITGLLVYHDGNFLQVLEGPRDAVEGCFARIRQDPRHDGVQEVIAEEAESRIFGEWEMAWIALDDSRFLDREGFLNLRRLRTSETMQRAERDIACRIFLDSFMQSVRGGL